jgi:two-component system, sensor histidine kinase and response regulator
MASTRILITEDEVLIAREIEAALEELGYTVVGVAHDGNTALQKVAETCPDLVLMDIVMPGEWDGIETADQIRTRFQIPVIYLTAYADSETLQRAKITEPFGYILKPFQPQDLNTAIQIASVRHHAEQLKLNTLRSNISASLPHEVNTALGGILGCTDFLLKRYYLIPSTEVLELIQCIHVSAIRLEKICHNLLLHAKLELLATNPQQLEQLKQAITWKKAEEFNRLEDLTLESEDIPVQISETYLKKIVEELLDNAFKFSKSGTKILVQSSFAAQIYRLSVRDRGRGMATEQIATLGAYMQFERKYYEQQGLGFGLALVKRLVELHGGTLTIKSVVGEGTDCIVELPTSKG